MSLTTYEKVLKPTTLSDIDFNELKKIKKELKVIGYRLGCIIAEESWNRAREKMNIVESDKKC